MERRTQTIQYISESTQRNLHRFDTEVLILALLANSILC